MPSSELGAVVIEIDSRDVSTDGELERLEVGRFAESESEAVIVELDATDDVYAPGLGEG